MSEKYGNPCATYNIPLNISENDIFRIGRTHLQHFIQVNSNVSDIRTDDCKPMMLKMHLELDDSPSSIGEAEERNIVHNNSNNGLRQTVQQLEVEIKALKNLRQSVQQHEEEIKALKDALLQAKENDVVNRIDKAPDVDNNATQESNSNKQANNENKHNDTQNVARASEGHHRNRMPEEKPEVIDLRDNCVYIQDFKGSDGSLETTFSNVRKLANEMKVEIPDDSVIHIDVRQNFNMNLDYFVYFCNAGIKKEFLKNRHFYAYNPETSPLRIFDYSNWGVVDIKNFQSSDLSLKTAYTNVIGIAKKMGITITSCDIDHIDVFSTKLNILNYSVQFAREYMRKQFVKIKYILTEYPETKSLEISDAGGHILGFCNVVNNFSMTVASANVIGLAELCGLSLAADDIKRIYVLNAPYSCGGVDLIVEFSSRQVKEEFLEKKHKLVETEYCYSYIEMLDINEKKNIESYK